MRIMPQIVIVKMQGVETHQGKRPPPEFSEDGKEEDGTLSAKCRRQCRELEYIIEKLKAEGNYEGAEGYAAKLSRMKSKLAVEEDFVWRNR